MGVLVDSFSPGTSMYQQGVVACMPWDQQGVSRFGDTWNHVITFTRRHHTFHSPSLDSTHASEIVLGRPTDSTSLGPWGLGDLHKYRKTDHYSRSACDHRDPQVVWVVKKRCVVHAG